MSANNSRRSAIKKLVTGSLAATTAPLWPRLALASARKLELRGNINHSVCRWTFSHLPLPELCSLVKDIGFQAIDLVGPKDWPVLQEHGIYSSMCNGAEISLTEGWNHKEYHDQLVSNYSEMIPLVAKAGYKNLICFSGNRKGMDDETGLANCVEGLHKILPLAEKHGVIIHMELLNSKIDHHDYMADHSHWGVALCRMINSNHFRLLYDIYHMQIDEGDVIRTIKENHQYIGHYHTAGVPGRHEIDDSQELYYPAVMKAIWESGFKGYVAQEFIPTKEDKNATLKEAIRICDI